MGHHPARRPRRTVAAVALLAVAAAGCGEAPGDESTSTAADAPATTTTTSMATTTSEAIGRAGDAPGAVSPLDELPSSAGVPPTTTAPAPTTTTGPDAGIGAPRDFVELGQLPVSGDIAVRLDDRAARSSLEELLQREDVSNLTIARAALNEAPPDGEAGFAFVLLGCAETSAELGIDSSTIEATLTGNDRVACVVPSAFLAVFTVPDGDLTAGVQLVGSAPPAA